MRAIKVTDTAGNTYYIEGQDYQYPSIVKNTLFDKNDYKKTYRMHFFSSSDAMHSYAEEHGLSMYKMPTFCKVEMGNSRDEHVYKITR